MLERPIRHFLDAELGESRKRARFLLAVSGGVDSMALLEIFTRIHPLNLIHVAHFDHTTRPDSAEHARFVVAHCERLGVCCTVESRPSGKPSDEDTLRRDRLDFLERTRIEKECDWIVTAHHLNDQMETMLFRLIRGTGLDGLKAISTQRGPYLRPFLKLSKQELIAYAKKRNVPYEEDPSNQLTHYTRNRIRKELLPVLYGLAESHGGGEALTRRWGELAEEVKESESALAEQTRALYGHIATSTSFWLRLDLERFAMLSRFWQARVLRRAVAQLEAPTLSRPDTDRLLNLIASKGVSISLTGFRYMRSCGFAYLQTAAQSAHLKAPRLVSQTGNRVFLPELGIAFTLGDPAHQVRFFSQGDRWGSKKLKEVFLLHRIPLPERSLIPLATRQNQIVWLYPQSAAGVKIQRGAFPFAASVKSLEISHTS